MKISDTLRFALENLGKMKLRTFLTVAGVTVGVASLAAMVAFGSGLQKNVADTFARLDLFNTITVLPEPLNSEGQRPPHRAGAPAPAPLDDALVAEVSAWDGVSIVFPEQRFPATARLGGREEFLLVTALPAAVVSPPRVTLRYGRLFPGNDGAHALVTRVFLRRLDVRDEASVVGKELEISTVTLKAGGGPAGLPVGRTPYRVTVIGVIDQSVFGAGPFASQVILPAGFAARMERLPFSNVWDLMRARDGRVGYPALSVRLKAARWLAPVKKRLRDRGLTAVSGDDQFAEIRNNFIVMDMVLAAVGMIALFVAALGITNTMVMSILERTREIGVLKAVGAEDRQVRRVFLVESALIGLAGGLSGLLLGWAASSLINHVVNIFLARQGVPYINYFHYPWWLCAGAVLFAVLIALLAGLYPAQRAARLDPVRALRHD